MCSRMFRNCLYLRFYVYILVVSVVILPLAPVTDVAAESRVVPVTVGKVDKDTVVVLKDHQVLAATNPKGVTATEENVVLAGAEEPAVTEHKKTETEEKTKDIAYKKTVEAESAEETEEGLTTLSKVGIGVVGVAAVVGGAMLLGGGGGDSGPKYPTAAELVGQWNAQGTSAEYRLTYTGVFNFYAIGSHVYDIYLSNGTHSQGSGTWSLTEGTNTLTLKNNSGSTYVGDFQNENFTTITMTNTNLKWELVLNKN